MNEKNRSEEETVDMDEVSKNEVREDSEIEEDSDMEPDAELEEDDEVEEVEGPEIEDV